MIAKDHIKGQEVMPLSSKVSGDLRRDEAPIGAEQTVIGSPDSEVVPKGKRRYLTAAYKARILRLADGCKLGELGALLRREGLVTDVGGQAAFREIGIRLRPISLLSPTLAL